MINDDHREYHASVFVIDKLPKKRLIPLRHMS